MRNKAVLTLVLLPFAAFAQTSIPCGSIAEMYEQRVVEDCSLTSIVAEEPSSPDSGIPDSPRSTASSPVDKGLTSANLAISASLLSPASVRKEGFHWRRAL